MIKELQGIGQNVIQAVQTIKFKKAKKPIVKRIPPGHSVWRIDLRDLKVYKVEPKIEAAMVDWEKMKNYRLKYHKEPKEPFMLPPRKSVQMDEFSLYDTALNYENACKKLARHVIRITNSIDPLSL